MDDLDPYLDTTSSTCLWGTVWRMRLRRLSVTSGRPWPYVWDLSPTSTWRRPWLHWPRQCLPEDQCLACWIWNTCTGLERVLLLWKSHVNNWFNGAMSWTTPIVRRDREEDSGYYRVHSVDCVCSLCNSLLRGSYCPTSWKNPKVSGHLVNRLNRKFGPTMLIETLPTLDLVLL